MEDAEFFFCFCNLGKQTPLNKICLFGRAERPLLKILLLKQRDNENNLDFELNFNIFIQL